MKVTAKLKNLRISARKVRLIADLIKGEDALEALDQMDVTVKAGNEEVKGLLQSAIANAENNFGLDKTNLFILNVIVEEGATLKRWRARAFGRAGAIRKRTSKVILILEERVEGKGRKSKEEMEKAKKAREEAAKKKEKEVMADMKQEEKMETKSEKVQEKPTEDQGKKTDGKGNWTNKIFRRKSM